MVGKRITLKSPAAMSAAALAGLMAWTLMGERVAELIAAVAEVSAGEAGPGVYRRASERPVASVSTLAGTRVPRPILLQQQRPVRSPGPSRAPAASRSCRQAAGQLRASGDSLGVRAALGHPRR